MKLPETQHALQIEIEKRRQLEKALNLYKERFRKLEQTMLSRLARAQRMEAIGALASGIAHDFNNILAVISGNCELAGLVLKDDSPAHPYLKAISKAGQRAKDLVQQILTFAHNTDQNQSPTLIHVVVKEALKLLRASLPANIEFRLDICQEMHYVLADVTQIYQIFIELCTHAAHFMEAEGGVLSVKLSRLDVHPEMTARLGGLASGPHLKLEVRNTGNGIEPDLLNRIFDSPSSSLDESENTKLGLSGVKAIVEAHQGKIIAGSKLGQGTTFTIFLPIIESEPD